MVFYLINIFIIFIFISLFFLYKKNDKKWSKVDDYLARVTTMVNSVRYGNLATKLEKVEHPDYKNLSQSINRMVETLNDREKMIIEYQSELTRQNKFLEAVINSLSDGILIIDENYKILRVTPKITEWFNNEGKKILNTNIFDYIELKENTKCEKFKNNEIFIKNNSDTFQASTMKLQLEDKKKRFVIIIKNITDQKELEKLREDFVATLTHDLKVPIIAEGNMFEFLRNKKFGEINPKQEEVIKNMQESNKELLELVQILLETYKIENSGIELKKQTLNLTEFLKNIVDDMQPIAEKSGFKIEFEPQVSPKISADEIQLKRAIKNIIQNAISHGDSNKGVKVNLEEKENIAEIRVIDYGKGIPKDEIEKIFQKFYSTAKKFRKIGTGLGLYLSLQIIKAHGGEITVKSIENVNTEFSIKLPRI